MTDEEYSIRKKIYEKLDQLSPEEIKSKELQKELELVFNETLRRICEHNEKYRHIAPLSEDEVSPSESP
ncbi:MAG: hypothetical protein KDK36_05815 [Leptospiraceae bacterium]|nr:hypothetical protein [Leptospiraceae bacterium]